MRKQIDGIQHIQPITYTTNIENQFNNIIVNNFGNETYDHISDDFLRQCLNNRFDGMKALLEKIHFSIEAKQNKNVRMRSVRYNQVEVARNQQWIVRDASETTDAMIRKGKKLLQEYFMRTPDIMPTVELDADQLEQRVRMFLSTFLDKSEKYYTLWRSIVNLIMEHTDRCRCVP